MNRNLTCATLALADVPPSPWKNGGGVTRELVAWPNAQDWVWRLSVAEVQSNGPFSRFDGVQRWFAVLAGAGVRLRVAGTATHPAVHTLTQSSEPFCFDGAAAVDCQLIDGATQDFNLMVRQGQAQARLQRVNGAWTHHVQAAGTVAIYANTAQAHVLCNGVSHTVPERSLWWQAVAKGCSLHVSASDALWMEITPCE